MSREEIIFGILVLIFAYPMQLFWQYAIKKKLEMLFVLSIILWLCIGIGYPIWQIMQGYNKPFDKDWALLIVTNLFLIIFNIIAALVGSQLAINRNLKERLNTLNQKHENLKYQTKLNDIKHEYLRKIDNAYAKGESTAEILREMQNEMAKVETP